MLSRALVLTACVICIVAPGCGQKKLSGTADLPDGFRAVAAHGASFAVPTDLRAQPEQTFANGGATLRLGTAQTHVDLLYRAGDATNFDALKRQYRVVFTTLDHGKITSDTPVKLDGADAANLMDVELPGGAKLSSLQVRRGNDSYVLIARGGDPGAVVDTFRLRPGAGSA